MFHIKYSYLVVFFFFTFWVGSEYNDSGFYDTLATTSPIHLIIVSHMLAILRRSTHKGVFRSGLKLRSLFTVRLFWTFHNKLHNMKALVILSHHDHHFSHLFVFMKKKFFCGSLWALLEYFCEEKLPTLTVST